MIVVGLVLVVIAVIALLVGIVGGANDPATLSLGSVKWETNVMALFITGAVAVLVLVVGLDVLRIGMRRGRERRRKAKELDRLTAAQQRPTPTGPTEGQETVPPVDRTAEDSGA